MTNYTITHNTQYNSHEVVFDNKPSTAVLNALKALKMRWNPKKACWYGFATEQQLIDAIIGNGAGESITGEPVEGATAYTDGYLGGGAVYGAKSNQALYGSDLSAAIRADLKRAGIKNVTVSCKTYAGGQHLTATVTLTADDIIDQKTYIDQYRVSNSRWISTGTEDIHVETYYSRTADEQEEIRRAAAAYQYDQQTNRVQDLNIYHLDNCKQFSESGLNKIMAVNRIIKAYRYDESNAMVDYFDTNFYYSICTKPAKSAKK